MTDVILSERAKDDLQLIDNFGIEAFGMDVATTYMLGFHTAFQRLSDFPETAPVIAGIKPRMRCLSYRSHRIFYISDAKLVTIVRILHHAMNAARHLRQ